MISLGIANLGTKISASMPSISPQLLVETQIWCSRPTAIAQSLRSPELDPSNTLKIRTLNIRDREDIHKWVQEKYEAYRLAVAEVAAKRSALLREFGTSSENAGSVFGGKLLRYYPLETVSDGAAEASSKGFFDVEDAPPWDTWLAYSEGAITSWVPDHLISRAQAGLDANPVDCIHWLDHK